MINYYKSLYKNILDELFKKIEVIAGLCIFKFVNICILLVLKLCQ